jgi:hypothetical protein
MRAGSREFTQALRSHGTTLPYIRQCRIVFMYTIIETEQFSMVWPRYWDEEEVGEFCLWLAQHASEGDVIPGSGGCRKIRYRRVGMGKSGGLRVIHYNKLDDGVIWLVTMYGKNVRRNIRPNVLKAIKETIDG